MLIDSNILIYALNSASPKNKIAQEYLQSHREIIFAQQNIFETLRILTHAKFSSPYTSVQAVSAVTKITDLSRIITPNIETADICFALISKYNITGTEIFDAYLVATALSNDIYSIATDNTKHLQKYSEITVINPFI